MKSSSGYYQHQPCHALVKRFSWPARQRMFASVMSLAAPTPATTVLDVGVTSDRREDSNFFEKLYPYPWNLTAIGIENASFLAQEHPGLQFVIADGLRLPFSSKHFDLVVSFALVEHVGSRERQCALIHELCRVGRICCVATPNRWFPVEFHSVLPFAHWLPRPWFQKVLKWLGKDFYAREENLRLLAEKELLEMFPQEVKLETAHHALFGFTSNLLVCAREA